MSHLQSTLQRELGEPTYTVAKDGITIAMPSATLGDLIEEVSEVKQVGVINTTYQAERDGDTYVVGRTTEPVVMLECPEEDEFYAVEVRKGIAIIQPILDEEMLAAMRAQVVELDFNDGDAFVYEQVITDGLREVKPIG